jgi:hypothetical protein
MTLSRRQVLKALSGLAAGSLSARPAPLRAEQAGATRPVVGAIRWDAWQSPGSMPTEAVTRALSPAHYWHRLPFFAQVSPEGRVSIDGGTQHVMDLEIALARRAGLDYWAFVYYPEDNPMSVARRLYLASTERRGLKFCLISSLADWGHPYRNDGAQANSQLDLLRHPDYQRVDGRPLYFFGFLSAHLLAQRWGGTRPLRAAVERFRALAVGAGAGNPYIVLMARPDPGLRLLEEIGADAIGAYAIAGSDSAAPYAALAQLTERRWADYTAAGVEVVPTVMTGWDRRPRIEAPMPWEHWQRPGVGMDRFYGAPTAEELAQHLSHALEWIEAHPHAARARAALIYAWNENDEGGWLVPTLPFDDSRITTLRRVLCAPGRGTLPEGCR